MAAAPISGFVATGFEEVRAVFAENFISRGELGAACAVVRDGETVVDLWGGHTTKARTEAWQADTLVLVYSLSKGISGLAAALAHSRGHFDFDAPVADVWPEFGVNGKQNVTIRQLLSEQAGLARIDTKLGPSTMRDPIALADTLARQAPDWTPGDFAGNHALTIGWLASEVIRRTDPSGRTLGPYVAEEIARPLDAEFYLGLPDSVDRSRIARIDGWSPLLLPFHLRTLPWRMVLGMMLPWTLTSKVLNNPSMLLRGPVGLDDPAYWAVENGGAGGISNARSIASIYGAFADGGRRLGVRPDTLANLSAPAPQPRKGWRDKVLTVDLHYSLGLEKPFPDDRFGSDDTAYGTFALGGGFAFADPTNQLGYAYTTNKLGFYRWGDPREKLVRDAVYRAL
jgi:CubicO group peptidase (beta-lactamase class C family)